MKEGTPLAALQALHNEMGDVFEFRLPGFDPVMLVGPDANRFVMVKEKQALNWRNEKDPVTDLLRNGVLVRDGKPHDDLRRLMNPSLHRKIVANSLSVMESSVLQISARWKDGEVYRMLDEMRKIALLILMQSLFQVDFSSSMKRLWGPILKNLKYISPGIWLLWPKAPRWGYAQARKELDNYLHAIIKDRRGEKRHSTDMLSILVNESDLDDEMIRDQLLTMLIAGHDTSTAILSWAIHLIGKHLQTQQELHQEIDEFFPVESEASANAIGKLNLLEAVVNESLRLYPPIHIGARSAAQDLDFKGHLIPEGKRVVYSIFLSHRHQKHWRQPNHFLPQRFLSTYEEPIVPYSFVPFGGGRRNCIGYAFAQLEIKLVLAVLLRSFSFRSIERERLNMLATLEPRFGAKVEVSQRKRSAR